MPPKASKKIKQLQLELQLHDKQLARAMDYAKKHPSESNAKIAKAYGVNVCTLRRRCRAKRNNYSVLVRRKQWLTGVEE